MARADPTSLEVTVAYSPAPRQVVQVRLILPAGSTVAQAVAASGLLAKFPSAAALPVGVWGRKAEPDQLLTDRDRVEIYRALTCDPKEARRIRYRQRAERLKAAG